MLRTLIIIASAALWAAIGSAGAQAQQAKVVNLLIDTGPGGAPFRDEVYAPRTIALLRDIFAEIQMEPGDTLVLKTFGNASLLDQLKKRDLNREIVFSFRGAKVEDLPSFLAQRVNSLAQIEADQQSDLMYGFADLAARNQCAKGAAVTTVVLTNGIEVGEVTGNVFTLSNIPDGSPFCGKVVFVGLWVSDPSPVPGMRAKAEGLFAELAKRIGFSEAEVRR